MIDTVEGRWFRTFAAVYECGSISKAAERLGYVQSTITTHIQQLERACGRTLFTRLPRGVEVTEAGAKLAVYANQFLQLGEAMQEALQSETEPKGTVRVQVLESFGVTHMPAVFSRFFRQFPQVQLELSTGFYQETLEALLERKIELGIVPKNPERDDIEFFPLVKEELVLIAAPELAHRISRDGFQSDQRVIGFGSRCIYQSLAEDALRLEWGVHRYRSLEYASLEMIKQTVMQGIGIALVPQSAVEPELQAGSLHLLMVKERIDVTHGIIAWKGKELPAAARALKQTLLDTLTGNGLDGDPGATV